MNDTPEPQGVGREPLIGREGWVEIHLDTPGPGRRLARAQVRLALGKSTMVAPLSNVPGVVARESVPPAIQRHADHHRSAGTAARTKGLGDRTGTGAALDTSRPAGGSRWGSGRDRHPGGDDQTSDGSSDARRA